MRGSIIIQEGGAPASAGSREGLTAPTTVPATTPPAVGTRPWRRARLVIRKVDPWSVLKFSMLFYFCLLLIMLLGSAIIFTLLKAFGVIAKLEEVLATFSSSVTISGGAVFRWLFLFGLLGTIVATIVTVFLAFLYNLIADVVGGIEIAVSQRD